MREEGLTYTVHCSLHLVAAYVQAVGALHGFFVSSLLVLGYPHTAVWIHCYCHGLAIWIAYSFRISVRVGI
jgi:hypothetical protein